LNPNRETRKIRPERVVPKLPEVIIGHRILPKNHKPENDSHPLEVLSENLSDMNSRYPGLGKAIPASELVLHILSPSKFSEIFESYRQNYFDNATFQQRRSKYYEIKKKIAKEFKFQMISDSNMQKLAIQEQSATEIDLGIYEDGNRDIFIYHEDPGAQHSLGEISLSLSSLYSPKLEDRSVLCVNPLGFSAIGRHRDIDVVDTDTRDVLSGSLDRVNQALHEVGLVRNLRTDALRFSDMSLEIPVFNKTSPNAEINTPIIPMGKIALQPLSIHISS
jgi:hypothetical protein